MSDKHKNYLEDLVSIFLEKMKDFEHDISISSQKDDKIYLKGQIMAYYDVLTTIKSQAELFDVRINSLKKNSDLERYLTLQ